MKAAKISLLGASAVLLIGLTACGPPPNSYDMNEGGRTREVVIHMQDGRDVPCVRVLDGISCDWESATVPSPRVPSPK